MGFFRQRPAPLDVVIAQRWYPSTYKSKYQNQTFPTITYVPQSPYGPAYGILTVGEVSTDVAIGDYIVIDPATGIASAVAWYLFVGKYEEVANAPV